MYIELSVFPQVIFIFYNIISNQFNIFKLYVLVIYYNIIYNFISRLIIMIMIGI